MTSDATNGDVVIEVASKQMFRGVYDISKGLPQSSNKHDYWFIEKEFITKDGYKYCPMDILLRNSDNTEWIHLRTDLIDYIHSLITASTKEISKNLGDILNFRISNLRKDLEKNINGNYIALDSRISTIEKDLNAIKADMAFVCKV